MVVEREGEMIMEVVAVDRYWQVIIPAVDGGVITTRPMVEAIVEVAAARQVRQEHNVQVVGLTLEID